jgi:class 3 adenylate cyclase/tetratricopeptide (TPR) repeat protein
MNCGQRLDTIAPAQPPSIQAQIPTSEEGKAERRIVTVLFCDVVGSTALSEQLDPETWTEIMNGVFERTIAAVRRYEGTVDRLLGDAIMALFGAPIAYEDDPYRAVLAAFKILQDLRPYQERIKRELAQAGVRLQSRDFEVRIGINTGLVVVSHVGTGQTKKWTPLGDTVNLAARMEQAAQPGTILITNDTYRMVAPFVEVEDLGPLQVKGKQEQVRAYRVLHLKEQASRPLELEELESPLIAREQEISLLRDSIDRLQEGEGKILCLIGEAGLGKSRLIRELKADGLDKQRDDITGKQGLACYESESLSFEMSQPYGLFQRLLRQVGNIKKGDSQGVVRQKITRLLEGLPQEKRFQIRRALEALFGLESEDGQPHLRGEDLKPELFEGVLNLIHSWATAKPTVLVFEDIHWADPASVELIHHLFPLVDKVPLLFLCVFRPDHHSPAWSVKLTAESEWSHRYLEISLEPFSAQESDALVGSLLNIPGLPERLGTLILGKTEGVPIFIEEIVRELIESKTLVLSEDGRNWLLIPDIEKISIPDSLESVLVARMGRLEENARRTLQLAAVIGRSFHYRVLKMITATDGLLDEQLRALQQAGMIREVALIPEREYIFRHVLAQEAAYNTILLKERRSYHQQVGEVMEQIFVDRIKEQAPLLAHHFHQAGDNGRALEYYSLAAQNAIRLYANREAVTHFTSAINIASQGSIDDAQLSKLHRGRGLTSETLGDFAGARSDHETSLKIARSAHDRHAEWRALLDLGKMWTSRDYDKAGDYYRQAQELARQAGDQVMLARTLNRIGNWHNNAENPLEAAKYHQEALEIFEELGDRKGLAATLDFLALVNNFRGNVTVAISYYNRAITLFRELDDRPGLASGLATRAVLSVPYNCYFVAAGSDNPLVEGLDYAAEALEIAIEIGKRSDESFAYWPMELLYAAQGQYGKALDAMQRGLRIAVDIGHSQWTVIHHLSLGITYCDLLAPEKVGPHCQKALMLAREIGSPYLIYLTSGILARAFLSMDDLAQAEECLTSMSPAETPMDTGAKRYWWGSRAELALAKGDAQAAIEIVEKVITSVENMMPGCRHSSFWRQRAAALVAVGRTEEAESTLLEARDHAQRIGERSQLWRIQADLGHLYGEMKRNSEAKIACSAAQNLIEELTDSIPDKALKDIFFRRAIESVTLTSTRMSSGN